MIASEISSLLARRINLPDIRRVVLWCDESPAHREALFELALSGQGIISDNALWCLTHLRGPYAAWLQSRQDVLIDSLLAEQAVARKRMLLQLLRQQDYTPESLRTDFLDFCLSKINSEAEPYAIRCFSLYIAYAMCRCYPELVAELEAHIELLGLQSMSAGLKCARRKVAALLSK